MCIRDSRTSYWVQNHTKRSFVSKVDVVSGPGYDRMSEIGEPSNRYHDLHRVVSNLGVFDFDTPDRRMRLRSIHPGVEVDEVVGNTDFEIVIPDDLQLSRVPSEAELEIIKIIDPTEMRYSEVQDA